MKKNFTLLRTMLVVALFSFVGASLNAQGLEDFTNCNATGSYGNNNFVGNDGITWTYIASRNANNDANGSGINLPALMLKKSSENSKISSSVISGGIGNFSVKLYKGFTGKGNRQVELFINGVSKGKSTPFNDFEEHIFQVNDINVAGDFTIQIRNVTSKQVIIDDISWTGYVADPNELSITANPTTVSLNGLAENSSVKQTITVTGANLTADIAAAISGADAAQFAISPTSLPAAGGDITVTYTPSATAATHTATLTLSSTGAEDVTIILNGETTLPELTAPTTSAATNVSENGFTANWSNVPTATGYELNVYTKETSEVATDLFFSEYVEGSASNKYLEIYNGTGADVDLSDYQVLTYGNGKTEPSHTQVLSGTLVNGATLVIAHSKAKIYTGTVDLTSTVTYFNGDDAVALKKISTDSYVDIIGSIGEDPVTVWEDGEFSTAEKTLVRKATVVSGVTTNPTAGFPTLATEWEVYDTDDVSHLGSHTMTEGVANIPVSGSPFTVSDGTTTSYEITGLDYTKTYYYTVKALRDTEVSDESNEVEVYLASVTKQDGNWNDAETWASGAVPTASDNVIIAHNVSSSAAVSVNNLTIKPGASLKVDGVLTSTNPVILQGDATNGAATLISNNAVEGKMTYPLSPNRSWYVSSPVANASKSSLGEASQVYYRDEANDNYSEAGETLEVGRGYVIKPSTDVVMEFSGFFKTGATMVSVSNNGNAGDKYRGYNLIGNPYPAALNWETVYNNNANAINPTMWYNENGVFKTYIATSGVSVPADVKGYVPPMQGFWVLKAAEYTAQGENPSTATLNFDNTMLSHNTFETANLLKAPAISENQILRLQLVDDNNMKDETVIYFNAKAENAYGDYDSRKMFNEKGSSLYTNVAGQKLVINGMNTIPYDKEIALNLFIKESGSFTISANEFSNFNGEKVWLRDNLKGVDHDLLSGDYTFTADENTSNGRFSVIFPRLDAPTGLEETLNDALSLSVDNGNLQVRVKDVAEDAMVSVFNSLGQRVASQLLKGTVTTVNLSNAGVYVVKVMNGSEELTEKVVVR